MAKLKKVGVLPTQHEKIGQKGGSDSQNQQEVDSHTGCPDKAGTNTCISSGCLGKRATQHTW